jgi:hypothetical protein
VGHVEPIMVYSRLVASAGFAVAPPWNLARSLPLTAPRTLSGRRRPQQRRVRAPVAIAAGDSSAPEGSGDSEDGDASGDDARSEGGDAAAEAGNVFERPAFRARADRQNDLLERLEKISLSPKDTAEEEERRLRGERYLSRETQLLYLVKHFYSDTKNDFEKYLSNPLRLVVAGSVAILFGFFAATAASTIIGSVADWDPLAAAVLLGWTETFTRFYYRTQDKSITLRLINAFKVGLIYGMCVDAFKLST